MDRIGKAYLLIGKEPGLTPGNGCSNHPMLSKNNYMKWAYVQYWTQKGDYGIERIRRAEVRKAKRKAKPRRNRGFTCEMGDPYCERRGYCNGDC